MGINKKILSVLVVSCFSILQLFSENYLEIVYEDTINKSLYTERIDNVKRFYVDKDKGEITTMKVKIGKDWKSFPLNNAIGYSVFYANENATETFKFINKSAFKLIEGDLNKNALYLKEDALYLIYVFLWKDTYVLQYNNKLIELKNKEQISNELNDSCLSEQIKTTKKSIGSLVHKSKKAEQSELFKMIEKCN